MTAWQVIGLIVAVLVVWRIGPLLLGHVISRLARRNGLCELCAGAKQSFMLNAPEGPPLLICSGCVDKRFPPYLKAYSLQRGTLVEMPGVIRS
jgi:hypothetical protein